MTTTAITTAATNMTTTMTTTALTFQIVPGFVPSTQTLIPTIRLDVFSLRTTSEVEDRRNPASESLLCCNSELSHSEDVFRFPESDPLMETLELRRLFPSPRPSEVFLLKIGMSDVRRPLIGTGLGGGDFALWQLLQVLLSLLLLLLLLLFSFNSVQNHL